MTPAELSRTVLDAVRRAVDAGELSVDLPERVTVTEPGPGGCGDFATNVALRLARPAGLPPLRVAGILRARLLDAEGVDDVVVTGPGFLNITLRARDELLTGLVREIRELGTEYGHGDALAGRAVVLRVPYEVRAEVVADSVARLVAAQGGRAEIEHGEPANLRPVPAPEDPAPLGADAARWALLHPAAHDRPRITADHLVQREINPLFRVRYAHARVRALTRNARDLGFAAEPGDLHLGSAGYADMADAGVPRSGVHAASVAARPGAGDAGTGEPGYVAHAASAVGSAVGAPARSGTDDPGPGTHRAGHLGPAAPVHSAEAHPGREHPGASHATTGTPAEPHPHPHPLQTPLTDHPRILATAATDHAPDRLARHLLTVADALLPLLPEVLPVGEEKPTAAHRARLALAEAAGAVLAGGLSLLGIDAPEHL
ncbi:ArgS-related anticodon-binding protein NrtL [Streptomyces sp. NBC_01601]|uniref:ArgS-related anticodon-binding protein NrtL n=1 Tax=Streptomyces sp. NBC_01601 TaxID=2975892 RepID=UPI002E2C33EA|nr:DALR anticodon-binding domain-containing protein [Streptomyces sp. NBC_01601]